VRELCATLGFHPVANADDGIEIAIDRLIGFPVGDSMYINCTCCFFHQFTLCKNVAKMLGNNRAFSLEKLGNVCLLTSP
jgi:hypothetical protein